MRAATELGLRTVAIYSKEDRLSLHRFKADEAYQIGEGKGPVEAYLDVDGIVAPGERKGRGCDSSGLRVSFGESRAAARLRGGRHHFRRSQRRTCSNCWATRPPRGKLAERAGVPIIPGTEDAVERSDASAQSVAKEIGYPADHQGGVRRRRTRHARGRIRRRNSKRSFEEAQPRSRGGLRQRRGFPGTLHPHAAPHRGPDSGRPARQHPASLRARLFGAAAPSESGRSRAGRRIWTRRFATRSAMPRCGLRAKPATTTPARWNFWSTPTRNEWYFIEVNPRIQVEHTVTEMVTGIDLVRSQILIAQGAHAARAADLRFRSRTKIPLYGYALQCRVTTEDPAEQFRAGLRQDPRPIVRPPDSECAWMADRLTAAR